MSTDRYWDSREGRWIYDGAECTCDLMAHPCAVHDTDTAELWNDRERRAAAKALLNVAEDAREYLTTPNVSLSDWLRTRARDYDR